MLKLLDGAITADERFEDPDADGMRQRPKEFGLEGLEVAWNGLSSGASLRVPSVKSRRPDEPAARKNARTREQ